MSIEMSVSAVIEKHVDTPKYIYLENRAEYFSPLLGKTFKEQEVKRNLGMEMKRTIQTQELINMVIEGEIPKYRDVIYSPKEADWYYNTFRKATHPKGNPVLPKGIELLLNNLCGWDMDWIHWLNKAILYKHTHLDDVQIPCVILYGVGGSGKSTFIELLKKIFWVQNVMGNLRQSELDGSFDTVIGDRLIYEFAEITAFNTNRDRQLLNKLKNIVFADTITVNRKNKEQYQVPNYAWYFVTSNSLRPVAFDGWDSGNRRFSCFRSTNTLTREESELIYGELSDAQAIANYIAWLHETYPEVAWYKNISCLENKDKLLLVQNSQSEVDEFVEYIREKYESGYRLTHTACKLLLADFCRDNCYNEQTLQRLFKSNCPFQSGKWKVEGYENTQHYYEIS